jgi:7 transmembrane receptor (rhodopsin family)
MMRLRNTAMYLFSNKIKNPALLAGSGLLDKKTWLCDGVKCRLYDLVFFTGKKAHRTPKNLYIVNLAIAGISMCVICIPPTLWQCLYGGEWFLGRFACKLVPTMQGLQKMYCAI